MKAELLRGIGGVPGPSSSHTAYRQQHTSRRAVFFDTEGLKPGSPVCVYSRALSLGGTQALFRRQPIPECSPWVSPTSHDVLLGNVDAVAVSQPQKGETELSKHKRCCLLGNTRRSSSTLLIGIVTTMAGCSHDDDGRLLLITTSYTATRVATLWRV